MKYLSIKYSLSEEMLKKTCKQVFSIEKLPSHQKVIFAELSCLCFMIVFRVLNDLLNDGVVDIVAKLLSKVAGLVIEAICLKFRENFRSAGLDFGVSHEFLASGSESSAF